MNDITTLLCNADERHLRQAREIQTLRRALLDIVKLAHTKDTGGAGIVASRALTENHA